MVFFPKISANAGPLQDLSSIIGITVVELLFTGPVLIFGMPLVKQHKLAAAAVFRHSFKRCKLPFMHRIKPLLVAMLELIVIKHLLYYCPISRQHIMLEFKPAVFLILIWPRLTIIH